MSAAKAASDDGLLTLAALLGEVRRAGGATPLRWQGEVLDARRTCWWTGGGCGLGPWEGGRRGGGGRDHREVDIADRRAGATANRQHVALGGLGREGARRAA